jgi:tetratricopeptide (TPR) repeat protein
MNIARRMRVAAAAAVVAVSSGQVIAQQPLAEARALYAAANYEEALSVLSKLDSTSAADREAEQYRAFCLIALGRTDDARRAIEAVVSADPLFVPRSSDVSPRILSMFADVRRRLLPDIARRAYVDGRSAFQSKDFVSAAKSFDQVMRLIDQEGIANAPGIDDLRILVAGFVDLTEAAASPSGAERAPEPAAPAETAPRTPPAAADGYIGPVAVRQELPPWTPPTAAIGARAYAGSVKVLIGPDGQVHEATIVQPVHPLYDPLVLQAARRWVYQPATRLGEPIVSEKLVQIRLSPR